MLVVCVFKMECVDGWTDGRMDGWMNEWMNEERDDGGEIEIEMERN